MTAAAASNSEISQKAKILNVANSLLVFLVWVGAWVAMAGELGVLTVGLFESAFYWNHIKVNGVTFDYPSDNKCGDSGKAFFAFALLLFFGSTFALVASILRAVRRQDMCITLPPAKCLTFELIVSLVNVVFLVLMAIIWGAGCLAEAPSGKEPTS